MSSEAKRVRNRADAVDPSGTRAEILNLARGYLQSLGFNGFSFQTIADALGIRKASIHYHFKSKEEMGLALVDDYIQAFAAWTKRKEGESSALKRMKGYFAIFESFAQDRSKICPMGVLSTDFHTLPKAMKVKLMSLHDVQRHWLIEVIHQGRASGEFDASLSAPEAADLILASVQGGVQLARVRGDLEPLHRAKKLVLKTLSR